MNKLNTTLTIIASALFFNSSFALAAAEPSELVTFQAGGTIKASEMNDNFLYLKNLSLSSSPNNGFSEIAINCSDDDDALLDYFAEPDSSQRWITLNLSGTCAADDNGELQITRDSIMLQGGEVAGMIKVVGKQDVVVKGVNILGKANDDRVAFIDSGSAVYFENNSYPVNSEFLSTGTSSIVYNDSVEGQRFVASLSSRLFFFSPIGKAQDIVLDTASSMEYTNLSSAQMTVLNASGFKNLGQGTLSLDTLNMGTGTGGQVYDLSVTNEVDLFANAALAVENQLSGPLVYVGAGSSLIGATVITSKVNIETGGSVDVDVLGTQGSPITDLELRGKSALWAENSYLTNVYAMDSSIDSANMVITGSLFTRKTSILSQDSFTLSGSADVGSFSYLEMAYPLADMCNNFNHINVEAWSFTDQQGFPYDCP
ncbi:hypothetical protein ACVFI8_17965 [Agarivorans sp. MS3-6]|uniref:hypothetical protein n=1 Tax=Agarivorans sp. TSD2052 TaxID=2937286 RepID=UPI00200DCEC1|nr:hypothetical protein [Agarivorans sp. TSD2052]UPW17265.1 hypothetical protein M0C34_13550 [Agarivorans sp. TSD2052]